MRDSTNLNSTMPHLRFLVVDDHILIRNMVMQNLKSLGATDIDKAVNGVEAWEMIKGALACNRPYNTIFLDWHMPEMEGIDVLKKCREEKALNKTAIIMLTAEQEESNILKAIEAGATTYVVKPISQDNFSENMDKIADWMATNDPELMEKIATDPDAQASDVKK